MKRFLVIATILTIVALASAPAFALEFITAGGVNGINTSAWLDSGFAASSGTSGAPGIAGVQSRYSGTSSFFGPSRFARGAWNPTTSGYYDIQLAWPSSAGQKYMAVNLYTGAETGGPADQWGNLGPQGVIVSGTMDELYRNTNVWNTFTTAKLTTGTTYKVGIYGGYKSPGTGAYTDTSNRVAITAFKFASAAPIKVSNGALNEYNELSWTKGVNNAGFNVYFGTDAGALGLVGSQDESMTTMGIDYESLSAGTYFWRVDSVNVDNVVAGDVYSFTVEGAPVPEPGSLLALGTGLIGLLGVIRRKRS